MSLTLFLARHGQTDSNEIGRYQGWGTRPLTDHGRDQAREQARYLAKTDVSALYTSPLVRARQTADIIASAGSLEPEEVPAFSELDMGELEGVPFEEGRRRYADFWESWENNVATTRLPNGETVDELQARAWSAVEDIRARHTDETVVVVSHYFTILSVICRSLDISLNSLQRFRIDNGSFSGIYFDDERPPMLTLLNHGPVINGGA